MRLPDDTRRDGIPNKERLELSFFQIDYFLSFSQCEYYTVPNPLNILIIVLLDSALSRAMSQMKSLEVSLKGDIYVWKRLLLAVAEQN